MDEGEVGSAARRGAAGAGGSGAAPAPDRSEGGGGGGYPRRVWIGRGLIFFKGSSFITAILLLLLVPLQL